MDERIRANKRRALELVGAAFVAILVVLWVIAALVGLPVVGGIVAVAVAGGIVAAAVRSAESTALTKARAQPASVESHPRFHNLVEGLCVAAGLPKPKLFVVDDDALNAFAAGRDPRRASLVLTTGMLASLSRIELEGVVAHELSHIKLLDILPATVAVTLVGTLAPGLVDRVVEGRRETLADVTGVALTRYPPGLISALEKLRDDSTAVRGGSPAIRHLWIEAPAKLNDHLPLEERIQALREL